MFYLYSGLYNFIIILSIAFINYIGVFIINKYKKKNVFSYVLVALNIITLLIFKYDNNIIFPLGISFYTFNNISYIIDVMKRKVSYEKNILYYLTYILLFCHVTMGPIVRYKDIKNNLLNLNPDFNGFHCGLKRLLWGLFKKVLIADSLGILYNTLISNNTSIVSHIFCLIVFALQLYIDFSSYCDMAIGLGKIVGINYNENFDYPYLVTSISEFWRKWHITLGNFFKEYVYFPLGGNRVSKFRHVINLLIVWILTGMWHGNTINFLLWGLYYGIIIILEKLVLKKVLDHLPNFIKHIYVIVILLFGYIFFSISDFNDAILFIKGLFSGSFIDNTIIFYLKENIVLLIISIILCFKLPNNIKKIYENNNIVYFITNLICILLYIISISYIINGTYSPFLYNAF
ncbi:MAG: MBOAT family protein [Bacilli bacterium]|nr:MBOAT family protein [Bacilli bacterium]